MKATLPENYPLHGTYVVRSVLGVGGFGATYLAEHIELGKLCAIKEYWPQDFAARDGPTIAARPGQESNFEWGLQRFLDEARTLARFRHRNVVSVSEFFRANGTAYMVLDYERGRSLKAWRAALDTPPTQEELDHLVAPLLDALHILHANGLLHRDIAPDNIYIRHDGSPVLLDFGAAREAFDQHSRKISAIIVKRGYSPPEQYAMSASQQGPWTDIYALSATLYQLTTGEHLPEATERIFNDPYMPVALAAKAAYRREFLAAVDWGLKVNPQERPQTVLQWRRMLLAPESVPIPSFEAPPSARMPDVPATRARTTEVTPLVGDGGAPKARRWGAMAAFSTALAVAAGSALYVMRERQPEPAAGGRTLPPTQEDRDTAITEKPRAEDTRRRDQIAALTPGAGQAERDRLADGSPCAFCPPMVVAPKGSFMMGSPDGEPQRWAGEKRVQVAFAVPFAIGHVAVTFDQWDACVEGGGCNGYRPGDQGWGRGSRPVINVSWSDAKAYAAWLSQKTGKTYRLPSEAEREYAARAGTTTPFWWGGTITPAQANYNGSYAYAGGSKGEWRRQTVPADSFQPNPWGLLNVHGNVLEWTEDCWNATNAGNPADGAARATGDCDARVQRGGSWSDVPQVLRSASRVRAQAGMRSLDTGFRVARTISPAP